MVADTQTKCNVWVFLGPYFLNKLTTKRKKKKQVGEYRTCLGSGCY